MAYNSHGKRIRSENLAGQVTTTAWDCCHKISETQPDGSTTTWDYDDDGRMVASSRLIPLDMTNVTWLTTCYEYDDLGRQTATWQTNYAEQVGLPATRTRYDALGRVVARIDTLGNTTSTVYNPDGRTVSVLNPNTSTRITTSSADGELISVVGTAVTPEFHTYGVLPDGTRWFRTVQGETASSPRFAKRYENLLGQTVREERSGFKGAVLATVNVYDALGRLVSTASDYEPTRHNTYDMFGARYATTQLHDGKWRKNEIHNVLIRSGGLIFIVQTNLISCSDSMIKPTKTHSARQLSGLSPVYPAHSYFTDIRGNVTERLLHISAEAVTLSQTLAYATNRIISLSRYRVPLMYVSVSSVTNTMRYDCLGRRIAVTDGCGNTTQTEYNALGQPKASIDALGNRTYYSYDQFGSLIAITNPLGHVIVYEYDLHGRKIYEGGATYPVRYTYDVFGNRTTMTTYRDESLGFHSGDLTTWLYDEASGSMTNKVYANGKGPIYNYTPDGRLLQRIWARGIVADYAYDGWNNLTNTVYSDNTTTVSIAYDDLGRQVEAHDAAGVTIFGYDDFGVVTNETVGGVAGTNTIKRFRDNFGRDVGYAINGVRQSALAYNADTGRLATMLVGGSETPFTWDYLAGSDLKSSLLYPNGLSVSWAYDANKQLLQVDNVVSTNVISRYDYVYDAAGRRVNVSKTGTAFGQDDMVGYNYNARNELTNATAMIDADYRYDYLFDDIGNREAAFERGTNSIYAANQLNQYSAIDDFIPEYDDDGNQILIKTATGVWSVVYNGENRPVYWINGPTNVIMSYDRMGRRIEYLERIEDSCSVATNTHFRFVYDDFCCVQRLDVSSNTVVDCAFIWTPADAVATSPLMIERCGMRSFFVTHDGYKNVSELIPVTDASKYIQHYEYAPFGSVTAFSGDGSNSNIQVTINNPFRFSSEYYDEKIGLVCYNYRHYNCYDGRWCSRDPIEERGGVALYSFLKNRCNMLDMLGLAGVCCSEFMKNVENEGAGTSDELIYKILKMEWGIAAIGHNNLCTIDIACERCQSDMSRSGQRAFKGGYAQYYEDFNWLTENDRGVHVRICTDDSGMTFGDIRQTAAILRHELIHANDHCRKKSDFECAEFTLAALNAGKFDDKICTEIHAYAQQNAGTGLARLEKDEVISKAKESLLSDCEIQNEKHVDNDFVQELEKRVTQMYDKCERWEAQ